MSPRKWHTDYALHNGQFMCRCPYCHEIVKAETLSAAVEWARRHVDACDAADPLWGV